MSDPVVDLFSHLAGQEIPGGCERCDAYQTVSAVAPGVWSLIVHHTTACPTWRARAAGAN